MSACRRREGRRIGDILLELGFASEKDAREGDGRAREDRAAARPDSRRARLHHPPRAGERARRAVVRPERVDQAAPDPASSHPGEERTRAAPRRRPVRSSASGCCRRARGTRRGEPDPADRGVRRSRHRPRRAGRGDRRPHAANRGDARDAGGELRGSDRRRRGGIRRAAVGNGRARSRSRPDRHHRHGADDEFRSCAGAGSRAGSPARGTRHRCRGTRRAPRRRSGGDRKPAGCAGSSSRQARRKRRGWASSGRHWARSRSASRKSRIARSPTRSRVEGRLGALAARVENIVTPDEVVALHDSLVAFEQRLAVLAEDAGSTAALDEQARSLAELRATVVGARVATRRRSRARRAARPDRDPVRGAARGQAGRRPDRGTRRPPRDGGGRAREPSHRGARRVDLASTLSDVRQGLTAQEEVGRTAAARRARPEPCRRAR